MQTSKPTAPVVKKKPSYASSSDDDSDDDEDAMAALKVKRYLNNLSGKKEEEPVADNLSSIVLDSAAAVTVALPPPKVLEDKPKGKPKGKPAKPKVVTDPEAPENKNKTGGYCVKCERDFKVRTQSPSFIFNFIGCAILDLVCGSGLFLEKETLCYKLLDIGP